MREIEVVCEKPPKSNKDGEVFFKGNTIGCCNCNATFRMTNRELAQLRHRKWFYDCFSPDGDHTFY